MDKRFSYDNMIKSKSIEPNDLIRTYKLDRCCDFMALKYNNPKLTQKQICKQLGFSDSTIKRYRDDIKMDSPYRRNTSNKRKKPIHLSNTVTENIIKNENTKKDMDDSTKNKIIEKRIKNRLKGGNISNSHKISTNELIDYAFKDNNLSGKELIEQAFKTTIND